MPVADAVKEKPGQLSFTTPVIRYRLRLSKGPEARAVSHIAQVKVLREALKKAELPVAVSAARRSLPKVSFGPALAAGHESRAEYFDFELWDKLSLEDVIARLTPALPAGYAIAEGRRIPLHYPSVEALADIAVYRLVGKWNAPAGPAIEPILFVETETDGLKLEVACRAKGASRPEQLVRLWPGWEAYAPTSVIREELWTRTPAGQRLAP